MPIANGFLLPDQFNQEYFFELKVGFCPQCQMVQLTELVDEKKMFHENYAFFSSTSVHMANHFKKFADTAQSRFLKDVKDPFVVEMGCNDGIMLQNFAQANIRHLGIEPSLNVAQAANKKGVRTVSEFFTETLAEKVVSENGKADLFYGANVMCHIPYPHSVLKGVKKLLQPKGVMIFEDPYLGDILEKTSYDQIYDEHAFYFSVQSVQNLAKKNGLEVFDVEPLETHGGSMRYFLTHPGARPIEARVQSQVAIEKKIGTHLPATYEQFKKNVEKSRDELLRVLKKLKSENKRVVAYGATSKSTTVTNYCGITPDLIEFISDTTPTKQNKFSPGTHIPVKHYEEFQSNYPECALLFAWNHAKEILAKETDFTQKGGRFLVYVPEVKFL